MTDDSSEDSTSSDNMYAFNTDVRRKVPSQPHARKEFHNRELPYNKQQSWASSNLTSSSSESSSDFEPVKEDVVSPLVEDKLQIDESSALYDQQDRKEPQQKETSGKEVVKQEPKMSKLELEEAAVRSIIDPISSIIAPHQASPQKKPKFESKVKKEVSKPETSSIAQPVQDDVHKQLDDEAKAAADLLRSEAEEQELAAAVNSIFMDPCGTNTNKAASDDCVDEDSDYNDLKNISPEKKMISPEKKMISPEKKYDDDLRKMSSEKKIFSPEKKMFTPEKKELDRTPQWNTAKYIDLNKEEIKLPSNINVTPEKTPQLKPANTTPQFGGNLKRKSEDLSKPYTTPKLKKVESKPELGTSKVKELPQHRPLVPIKSLKLPSNRDVIITPESKKKVQMIGQPAHVRKISNVVQLDPNAKVQILPMEKIIALTSQKPVLLKPGTLIKVASHGDKNKSIRELQ